MYIEEMTDVRREVHMNKYEFVNSILTRSVEEVETIMEVV